MFKFQRQINLILNCQLSRVLILFKSKLINFGRKYNSSKLEWRETRRSNNGRQNLHLQNCSSFLLSSASSSFLLKTTLLFLQIAAARHQFRLRRRRRRCPHRRNKQAPFRNSQGLEQKGPRIASQIPLRTLWLLNSIRSLVFSLSSSPFLLNLEFEVLALFFNSSFY